MSIPFSFENNKNINVFDNLCSGSFHFDNSLPISINSKFGDSVFDFTEKNNLRQKHLSKSYYILDFNEFTLTEDILKAEVKIKYLKQKYIPKLSANMIEDIKRFVTLFIIAPNIFNRSQKRDKASTIVRLAKNLIRFLSHVCSKNKYLKCLSDIKLNDIKNSLLDYPYRKVELRTHLSYLCTPLVSKNLKYGELNFNNNDLKNINWQAKKKRTSYTPLQDDLFQFMTETSFSLVSGFMDALEIDKVDSSYVSSSSNPYYHEVKQYISKKSFEEYIYYRELLRNGDTKAYFNKTYLFKSKFGFGLDKVHEVLYLVQSAAQYIIELTAMRYSEFSNLQKGCFINENGQWLIKSTVVKDKPLDAQINKEKWACCSFVVDAIHTLEEISRCNFNPYLFSNFYTVKRDTEPEKLTSSGLNYRLKLYLKKIDKEGKFKGQKLHNHQLRSTITEQLQRVGVHIQFITLHLKHTYNSFGYSVNKVTAGYGNYQTNIVKGITGVKNINSDELAGSLENIDKYAYQSSEQLLTEDNFFLGLVLTEKQANKYFEKLKQSGVNPIPVGIGYCSRDFKDTKSLQSDKPPCITELQCKINCQSKVITEKDLSSVTKVISDFDGKIRDQTCHLRGYYREEKQKLLSIIDSLKNIGALEHE